MVDDIRMRVKLESNGAIEHKRIYHIPRFNYTWSGTKGKINDEKYDGRSGFSTWWISNERFQKLTKYER